MKKHVLFFTIISIVGFSVLAFANAIPSEKNNEIDLNKTTMSYGGVDDIESNTFTNVPTIRRHDTCDNIGDKIGSAIKSISKSLSIEPKEFISSPVGVFSMLLIAYDTLDEKTWDAVGGTLTWLVVVYFLSLSFRHFHMREKITDTSNKVKHKVDYKDRYVFESKLAQYASAGAHGTAFTLITIICLFIAY